MVSDNFNQANLSNKLRSAYQQLDHLSGGTLGIIGRAYQSFGDQRADQAAAGMAYYTLFSLFPLLLILIAIGSSMLESAIVRFQLLNLVASVIPGSRDLIRQNIEQVLELRGPIGVISGIGLLWSGSGVFTILTDSINRAWPRARLRSFVRKRFLALTIVATLALLLVLSIIAAALLQLLASYQVPFQGQVPLNETLLWPVGRYLLPVLLRWLIFLALYRWIPNTIVRWSEAFWGALFAALAWEFTTIGFTWYVSSGLVQYQLVYGSLGAVVAPMFWIYLGSLITLFGAHLSAAIALAQIEKDHNSKSRSGL